MANGSKPVTEWYMAMSLAHSSWSGTSIAEGAFAILAQIRQEHPEWYDDRGQLLPATEDTPNGT